MLERFTSVIVLRDSEGPAIQRGAREPRRFGEFGDRIAQAVPAEKLAEPRIDIDRRFGLALIQ